MGIGQREVLMNSAENVSALDLNNFQRFLRSVTGDWMFAAAGSFGGVGDPGAAGYDRTAAVFSLGDSAAPAPSATAMRVDTLGGPLVQWNTGPTFPLSGSSPATNWGMDPYALIYWCAPNDLQTTHAAADPTNPRWDLVCVKLDDVSNDVADQETRLQKQLVSGAFVISPAPFIKRRKVTLTKQVVQGTPAGSPTIPAVPTGFQPYYAVRIPATFAGAFPVDDNFHDYRMPLGSFGVDVYTRDAVSVNTGFGAGFTPVGGALDGVIMTQNQTLDLVPRLPIAPHSCRLVGVSALSATITNNVTINLARYNVASAGTYSPVGGNATWLLTALNATSGNVANYVTWSERLAGQAGNSPPTAAIKPPWGTGLPSGYASRHDASTAVNIANMLGARYVTDGTGVIRLLKVRFHFAGMMF